jgi:hypothetical protein
MMSKFIAGSILPACTYSGRQIEPKRLDSGYKPEPAVIRNTIKTRLSEKTNKPWLAVLRKIDGRKTLRTIINEQTVSEAEIRVDLKNGIDNNIVYFKE